MNFQPFSLNNRVIVEPYKTDKTLKAEVRNGFAMIEQKVTVKGLKLLAEAHTEKYGFISKGSMVYIRESYLHSQEWAKTIFKSDGIEGPFIIVDLNFVEFIGPEKE
jgi:hypothetical protein